MMGQVGNKYHKKALQALAYGLLAEIDIRQAEQMLTLDDEEQLESIVNQLKDSTDAPLFFYDAGSASMTVLQNANRDCTDDFDACLNGLDRFVDFIGLP